MKRNKSFTGGRKSNQNPTMNKNAMFGLIRKAKAANEATYKFKKGEKQ